MDTKMAAVDDDSTPAGAATAAAAAAAAPTTTTSSASGSSMSPGRSVKPALKKEHTEGDGATSGEQAATSSSSHKKDRHLKWDEKAIEEHDQLRGTRMKIDEPNTPFAQYDSGAESDDSRRPKSPASQKPTLSWDVLQTRLDSVAAVREQYPSSPSSHGGGGAGSDVVSASGAPGVPTSDNDQSDVEEERKKEMRKLEFQEHRKRHYNEMELVRKFREEHPDDEDDDEELLDDVAGDADAEND